MFSNVLVALTNSYKSLYEIRSLKYYKNVTLNIFKYYFQANFTIIILNKHLLKIIFMKHILIGFYTRISNFVNSTFPTFSYSTCFFIYLRSFSLVVTIYFLYRGVHARAQVLIREMQTAASGRDV